MKYKFIVTLDNKSKREYQASSYQALYDYLYNDKKKDFEMYDIANVELVVKTYIYIAFSDKRKYIAEITDRQYATYLNDYKAIMYLKFANVDDYIRYMLAYHK